MANRLGEVTVDNGKITFSDNGVKVTIDPNTGSVTASVAGADGSTRVYVTDGVAGATQQISIPGTDFKMTYSTDGNGSFSYGVGALKGTINYNIDSGKVTGIQVAAGDPAIIGAAIVFTPQKFGDGLIKFKADGSITIAGISVYTITKEVGIDGMDILEFIMPTAAEVANILKNLPSREAQLFLMMLNLPRGLIGGFFGAEVTSEFFGVNALNELMQSLQAEWSTAETTTSPLILDLDGDGVETVNRTQGIHFDHNADGFAENTGWAGSDDGLLVRDLNGDGQINNGNELFGNNTDLPSGQNAANGFEALKPLDSNGDGQINSADAAWATLNVWKDLDGDGLTDAGELMTMEQAGVQSIGLGYSNVGANAPTDANGNQHQQTGSYTNTGGQVLGVNDVWFATTNWDTVDRKPMVTVSADIAALPDLDGPGTLGSLHQAMARDISGELTALVQQFASETDASVRENLVIDIIYRWAGVANVDPSSRGNYIDARILATLER